LRFELLDFRLDFFGIRKHVRLRGLVFYVAREASCVLGSRALGVNTEEQLGEVGILCHADDDSLLGGDFHYRNDYVHCVIVYLSRIDEDVAR
jgi:hypothetical protein